MVAHTSFMTTISTTTQSTIATTMAATSTKYVTKTCHNNILGNQISSKLQQINSLFKAIWHRTATR